MTNFKRPGVTKALELLDKKKFDCIIVKDLSRLGRDHIQVGNYLEHIFPAMEIRVISINDQYDSEEHIGSPGGKYDLKSKSEWQGKEHFIYNGEIIWYDDPGNILYGYLGKAMGFEDLTLLSAAGAVQILTGTSSWDYVSSFFDDPRDQKSIKMGIQRFKDTNSWIWW